MSDRPDNASTEEDDDFSDLPPGPDLEPMEITPERQRKIDEAAERLKKRLANRKKQS